MTNEYERTTIFQPAFDKRDPDPKKNYGIHGVEIKFLLKKDNAAVQFVIFTHWQLPHVSEEMLLKPFDVDRIRALYMPMAADLGYHSPSPIWEGQISITDDCIYIDGACYYDGSSLNAVPVYEVLLREGDEGVWKYLEKCYEETFESAGGS